MILGDGHFVLYLKNSKKLYILSICLIIHVFFFMNDAKSSSICVEAKYAYVVFCRQPHYATYTNGDTILFHNDLAQIKNCGIGLLYRESDALRVGVTLYCNSGLEYIASFDSTDIRPDMYSFVFNHPHGRFFCSTMRQAFVNANDICGDKRISKFISIGMNLWSSMCSVELYHAAYDITKDWILRPQFFFGFGACVAQYRVFSGAFRLPSTTDQEVGKVKQSDQIYRQYDFAFEFGVAITLAKTDNLDISLGVKYFDYGEYIIPAMYDCHYNGCSLFASICIKI